ncbi:hypothetical protein C818_00854 [Lachnospiraceae bacterium MD308]|jgi:ABC-type nitrate/sulfonate/bicarbonate transport system, ATPase component|nr:hypothetical protein C818_00854 [Lachnospiraceae bacterium MD308]
MDEQLMLVENIDMCFSTRKGNITALRNLNFEVKRGEFLAIVGPSGCGKSTLINVLAGILKPTGGKVVLDGEEVKEISPKMGMVFQKYAAFPWMTVRENISYGPRIARKQKSEIERVTNHYSHMVGLEAYEHLYPKELSGGMSKRVDIARAYANQPEVLLMDEPFGALDDITKKQMQIELLNIWGQENKTVIFITHDLEEAIFLADRILVLRRPAEGQDSLNFIQPVSFTRPREPELRTCKEFVQLKAELSEVMLK